MICSLKLLETKTLVYTHAGNPAFTNNSSIFIAIIGTLELCLYICVFQASIFGTAARRSWLKGKFHGATQNITPIGS